MRLLACVRACDCAREFARARACVDGVKRRRRRAAGGGGAGVCGGGGARAGGRQRAGAAGARRVGPLTRARRARFLHA